MNKGFARRLSSLEQIFQFIEESFLEYGIQQSVMFSANFIVEELFTNMVKYNETSSNAITISFEKKEKSLIISLTDHDVDSFDPRSVKGVDVAKPVQDRPVGGLGLYLVNRMVDKIDYEYKDRQSKITVTLALENKNV
jgi:anti-sigma regulatory factor (Ser/Thr protein kinase)